MIWNTSREKWRITIKVQQKFSKRNLWKYKFLAKLLIIRRANVGIWTRGLFLTKETLYPWATSAKKERETGFEPATFSLEGWCSTNWATPAFYRYEYLQINLIFQILTSGESRIRTCEGKTNRFTVCPRWPLEYLPQTYILKEPMEGLEPTTCWLQISCSSQLSYIGISNYNKG